MADPPHDFEAEKAIIGSCLLDPAAYDEAAQLISDKSFYALPNRYIWEAITQLRAADKPIDLLTLSEQLKVHSRLQPVGGPMYLQLCADSVPTAAHVRHYAEMVRDKAYARKVITTGQKLTHIGQADEIDLVKAAAEDALIRLTTDIGDTGEVLAKDKVWEVIKESDKGGASCYKVSMGLEVFMAGLYPGTLTILAARTSVGKTAYGVQIGLEMAARNEGLSFLLFTLEMDVTAVLQRSLACLGHLCDHPHISHKRIKSGKMIKEDHRGVMATAQLLSELDFWIDDSPFRTMPQIASTVRRFAALHPKTVVVVDYLGLISRPGKRNREEEVGNITKAMKGLAKQANVPIILLCQMNRAVEQRKDGRPKLADLRESGAIEQDADMVVFLHKPVVKKTEQSTISGIETRELIIAKQRDGETGSIDLAFHPNQLRFTKG